MRVLITTDLIFALINQQEYVDGLTLLLRWLKRIKAECCVDPASIAVLTHLISFGSLKVNNDFKILRTPYLKHPLLSTFEKILLDSSKQSYGLLLANLNWLLYDEVDFIVTENKELFQIAKLLELDNKIYTIEEFIEKCSIEYADLDETRGVAIQKVKFGSINFSDRFFDTFREDYEPYYHIWLNNKANDMVYIANDSKGKIRGLLKTKIETQEEDYSDIKPIFKPAKRLKISSFKADYTGQKLSQRFLRIIFEEAILNKVDEIYITLFQTKKKQKWLVEVLTQWGFNFFGKKHNSEDVYVKKFKKTINDSSLQSFPFCSSKNGAYIIPMSYGYANQLLPPFGIGQDDSNVEPTKLAIKKVLILHSEIRDMKAGSILLFLKRDKEVKKYSLIAAGVVENIYDRFKSESEFLNRCRKRSVLTNETLLNCWESADAKPIVVDFLYNFYFNDNLDDNHINQCGLVTSQLHSQRPYKITEEQFRKLIENTEYEESIIVN